MKDGSQIHPVGTYWLGSEDTDMRKIELLPLRSRQSVAREDKRREEILCALVHSEVLSIALRGTYYLWEAKMVEVTLELNLEGHREAGHWRQEVVCSELSSWEKTWSLWGIVNGWHGEWGQDAGKSKITKKHVMTELKCHLKALWLTPKEVRVRGSARDEPEPQFGFWNPLVAPRSLEDWWWEGGQVQRQGSELECCHLTQRRNDRPGPRLISDWRVWGGFRGLKVWNWQARCGWVIFFYLE